MSIFNFAKRKFEYIKKDNRSNTFLIMGAKVQKKYKMQKLLFVIFVY